MQKTRGNHPTRVTVSRADCHLLPPGRAVPGSTCCRRTKHETSRHKSERLVSSNLRVSPQIESRRCRHRLSLQAVLAPGRQGRLPPAAAGPGSARLHLLPPGRAVPGSTCCRRAGQCPVPLAAAGQNTKPAAINQSGWFLRICGLPRRLRVGVADTGSACRPPIRGETCGFADPEGFNLWPSGASPEPAAASACRLSLQKPTPAA